MNSYTTPNQMLSREPACGSDGERLTRIHTTIAEKVRLALDSHRVRTCLWLGSSRPSFNLPRKINISISNKSWINTYYPSHGQALTRWLARASLTLSAISYCQTLTIPATARF
eukprot:g33241.t1